MTINSRAIATWAKAALRTVPGVRPLRRRVYEARVAHQGARLAELIASHYANSTDLEVRSVVKFLERHSPQMIPCDYVSEYQAGDTVVHRTADGVPFVEVGEDRVYFPPDMPAERIQSAVRCARVEQDRRSPHRYLHQDMAWSSDDVAVLIGASDGIFGLSLVRSVRKVYLFEADRRWVPALRRTFEAWSSKVEIVNAFVGAGPSSHIVSLDAFFATRSDRPTFIQADVEGCELEVLLGARATLASAPRLGVSICSYHRQEDERRLSAALNAHGFEVGHAPGFVLMYRQMLRPPYLRRGVLHARRLT